MHLRFPLTEVKIQKKNSSKVPPLHSTHYVMELVFKNAPISENENHCFGPKVASDTTQRELYPYLCFY